MGSASEKCTGSLRLPNGVSGHRQVMQCRWMDSREAGPLLQQSVLERHFAPTASYKSIKSPSFPQGLEDWLSLPNPSYTPHPALLATSFPKCSLSSLGRHPPRPTAQEARRPHSVSHAAPGLPGLGSTAHCSDCFSTFLRTNYSKEKYIKQEKTQ